MKGIITGIVITVLFVVLSLFAYKTYAELREIKAELEVRTTNLTDLEDKYNRTKAAYTTDKISWEATDKTLREQLRKKPKIVERVKIKFQNVSTGGGIAVTKETDNSDAITASVSGELISVNRLYEFKDFRLSATLDTWTSAFDYTLSQLYDIQIIQLKGDDYRVQVMEINKDTKEVVQTIEVKDFNVMKLRDKTKSLNFGVNLNIGGAALFEDFKTFYPDIYVTLNFMSYGETHLDSSWRFLSLGAGSQQGVLVPVSWNLADVIKLLSDAWIDLIFGVRWNGSYTGGIGLSSTF